jgi:uncharacterized protein (DUF849 family)
VYTNLPGAHNARLRLASPVGTRGAAEAADSGSKEAADRVDGGGLEGDAILYSFLPFVLGVLAAARSAQRGPAWLFTRSITFFFVHAS